ARNRMALVQVPPRGLWGKSGPIAHTTAESWLGEPLTPDAPLTDLVLRYLAAFGPATVKDMQTWSGLTRLAEVVDRLRPCLVTFTGEDGRELFDLPDAPRPAADHPAPPRLLYDFDNLLLSHADRSRVITEEHLAQRYGTRRPVPGWVLVDGFTGGDWQIERDKDSAVLTIRTFAPPADGLAEEGERLLRFAHADASRHEVRVEQL
ncbi:winged helix DNA-binding domain-containing protein, partial [Actinomadura adrarensis]